MVGLSLFVWFLVVMLIGFVSLVVWWCLFGLVGCMCLDFGLAGFDCATLQVCVGFGYCVLRCDCWL